MKFFLYGAGGHGGVVAEVARSAGDCEIVGVIDDDPSAIGAQRFGYRVRGGSDALSREVTDRVFIAVGDNHRRSQIAAALSGWSFPTLIHPTALVERDVTIDVGTVVMPRAIIERGATIGKHCIINNGAIVGHDSRVADFCHVSGNSVLGGGVTLDAFVFVAIGAVVTPGVTIGKHCLVSAGSVAARDFDQGATIIGNPGRPFFNRRDLDHASSC